MCNVLVTVYLLLEIVQKFFISANLTDSETQTAWFYSLLWCNTL